MWNVVPRKVFLFLSMNVYQEALKLLKEFSEGMTGAMRANSTSMLEFELREMEHIFGLLVMGSMIGIPSPPPGISIRILPYMLREIMLMQTRARDLDDIFGEIAGMLDI